MSCWRILNKKRCKKGNRIESENENANGILDDYHLKILVIGPPNVGKTAICTQFVHHHFPDHRPRNHLVDIHMNHVECIDSEASLLQIINVSLSFPMNIEQGDILKIKSNILESEGYVVIYSVTDRGSWEICHQIINYIYQLRKRSDIPLILVGNKTDQHLERCVSRREAQIKSFHLNISFSEISAKMEKNNVVNVFHDIVRQIRCVRMRTDLMTKDGIMSPNTRRKTADVAKELLVRINVKPSCPKSKVSDCTSITSSPKYSFFRKNFKDKLQKTSSAS